MPQCYKGSCAPLRPPAFCRAVFFLFYREKEKKPPTTPKKEKMRPKGTPLWKPRFFKVKGLVYFVWIDLSQSERTSDCVVKRIS